MRVLCVVLLVAGLIWTGATSVEARRKSPRLTVETPPLSIPARSDIERWTLVRIPVKGSLDIAGMEMVNVGTDALVASHHLRVYSIRADRPLPVLDDLRKRGWSFGFDEHNQSDLVGGSQSAAKRQVASDGLAIRLPAIRRPRSRKRFVWLAIDSHWINGSDQERTGRVRITLIPAKPPLKRFLKPIFEGTANAGLFVAPGTVRSTEDSTRALNGVLAAGGIPLELNDSWGPGVRGVAEIAPSSGALPSPTGPACVTFLTAHMHLRGKLFGVDFIDSDGQTKNGPPTPGLANPYEPGRHHLFVSTRYDDPTELHFDPPRYVTPGQRFHYACWHDNGVVAPPKLTCVGGEGLTPGSSAADTALGRGAGPGTPCHQEGPNQTECEGFGPAARCVRANLVFGGSADDDMCILPGGYYDPNPEAPPGSECDLSLMPILPEAGAVR